MADEYKDQSVTFAAGNARFATGTRVGATGFKIGGADLNTLYEDISSGSAAPDAVTGFKVLGIDLGAIFAGEGTLSAPGSAMTGTFTIAAINATPAQRATGAFVLSVTGGNPDGSALAGQIDGYENSNDADDDWSTYQSNFNRGNWWEPTSLVNAVDFEFRVGTRVGTGFNNVQVPTNFPALISTSPISGIGWNTLDNNIIVTASSVSGNVGGSFQLQVRDGNNISNESSILTVELSAEGGAA